MRNIKKTVFYIILVLITIGLVLFIYYFSDKIFKILAPFFMGVFLAYVIYPLVIRFERRGIKRSYAILIIYTFTALCLAIFLIFIAPHVVSNAKELFNTLPDIASRYREIFNAYISKIKSSKWPPEVKNVIFGELNAGTGAIQRYATQAMKKSLAVLASSIGILLNLVLSMIIAYYILKDIEGIKKSTLMLAPKKMRNELINIGRELNAIITNFIRGQLTTATIVGLLETVGLYLVHVKYPFILGVVGGIANIIPYFGPVLGAIPAISLALLQSPVKALLAALVFIIVQQIDNAFISPKIIEGKLGLHPITTIIAVLVGGEFFGIIGMLLAVPVTAMIKVVLKRAVDLLV